MNAQADVLRQPVPTGLPASLTAHVLRFEGHVVHPLLLNEHKGSAIRGALFHALRGRPEWGGGFCVRQELTSCHPCDLHTVCPISALVATVRDAGPRGIDPPRPFTIEPPLSDRTRYAAGEPFAFGLTLFGAGRALLPYVVSAVRDLQRHGFGQTTPNRSGRMARGTFALERIQAVNPLTGVTQSLLEPGAQSLTTPTLTVTCEDVVAASHRLSAPTVELDLLTPLRLIDRGQLVHRIAVRPLIQRLIERCLVLAGKEVDVRPYWPLLEQAEAIAVREDRTRWVELDSYSTRRNAHAPLSGLVGRVILQGDLQPFLPWLVWGQVVHAGKETTKGNGWYVLR